MIYCREKLIDILLESPWISLEERFDFDVILKDCIKRGFFTQSQWSNAEDFLTSSGAFTLDVKKVIVILTVKLGYTDVYFLGDKPEIFKSLYKTLEEGVRL